MTAVAAAPVRLDEVRPVLDLYYRGLCGRVAHLASYEHDADEHQRPDSWHTLHLPGAVDLFGDTKENLGWYRVAVAHRAAHYEQGTFGYDHDRDAPHFERLRPHRTHAAEPEHGVPDLGVLFRLFTFRSLALEVFSLLEDLRVDAGLERTYPGLRRDLRRVQSSELGHRPPPASLPPRTALLEMLARISLGADAAPELPALMHDAVRLTRSVARRLHEPDATVEDVAEATLRVYSLTTALPNLRADYGGPTTVDIDAPLAGGPWWRTDWPEPGPIRLEGDEVLETVIDAVRYRDGIWTRFGFPTAPRPGDFEAIYRMRPADQAELRDPEDDGGGDTRAAVVQEASEDPEERPRRPPEPLPHEHHDLAPGHRHEPEGELTAESPRTAVYPEWDHVAGGYVQRWCRVREEHLDAAETTRFFERSLELWGRLVPEIGRQLEQIVAEGMRVLHRQVDGDDLDLDAAVESLVDLRAGVAGSEAIHQRLAPAERDVAAAFLLDVSSSTADRITPERDAGEATMERIERLYGRRYRRIIDLERETAVILMTALERTGDAYGVYGFSGTGRDDVRFVVVKDLAERMSRSVAARIENLRPVHCTRMGAAVRHATARLRGEDARTKLLVLVSDGRPFDIDYGQQYGEGAEFEYAAADTRQALLEATRRGIRPFLLTVDPDGASYLGSMAMGLDYEVLSRVEDLPVRLVSLYRRLAG